MTADLLDLARSIASRALPGEEVEAFVARSRRCTVRAYEGEVEALTQAAPSGIGVRVIRDGRQGFAHAGTLDGEVIAETLAEARDNRVFAEPDEHAGLAVPDGVEPIDIDLYREQLVATATERKVALALELEARTLALDHRVKGVRVASYGDAISEAAVATSTGIAVGSRATSCWLSVSALATDGNETQIGGGIDVGRAPDDLDIDVAARDAVDRATRLLGARPINSQRMTIVFDPRIAASFLAIVGGMFSGERVLKGRTPFGERLDEQIAASCLTLVDDATDPRSFGADSHDGEGLATRRTPLIVDGVLRCFLYDTYAARRAGKKSTASAVRGVGSPPAISPLALSVLPGMRAPADLIASVGEGLLVMSISGLHSGVNAVSGDFSVGAEGVRISGGAMGEPVREITIASTIQRMLQDVVEVGDDLEWLPSGDAGASLVIADVSVSGR